VYIIMSRCIIYQEIKMPILKGRIASWVRERKLVRRTALVGGIVVGIYYIGVAAGWWPNFLA